MIIAGKVYGKTNEFENMVIDLVDNFPSNPVEAQIVWHIGDKTLYIYDGSNWVALGSSGTSATLDTITVFHDSHLGRHTVTDDEMITLNYGETNDVASTNQYQWGTDRAGIEIDRGTQPSVSLFYDETTDKWSLTNDGVNAEIIMTYDPSTGTGTANDYFLRLDGGNSPNNDISWDNHRLTNLSQPIDAQDAVNKIEILKSIYFGTYDLPYYQVNTYTDDYITHMDIYEDSTMTNQYGTIDLHYDANGYVDQVTISDGVKTVTLTYTLDTWKILTVEQTIS